MQYESLYPEEGGVPRRATDDSVILGDDRVLENLLHAEDCGQQPSLGYFGTVQKDVQPFMRTMVTTWLLEVCRLPYYNI